MSRTARSALLRSVVVSLLIVVGLVALLVYVPRSKVASRSPSQLRRWAPLTLDEPK